MEELTGILAKLKAQRRPIADLLNERKDREQSALSAEAAGDNSGGGEMGSTRSQRQAAEQSDQPGMNEGGVGMDENLTQKILNFLKKKRLQPPGQPDPEVQEKESEPSPLPQPPVKHHDSP